MNTTMKLRKENEDWLEKYGRLEALRKKANQEKWDRQVEQELGLENNEYIR